MIRVSLLVSISAVLAACSSIKPTQDIDTTIEDVADISTKPLVVPALQQIVDTKPRTIQSKFVAVGFQALPDWNQESMQGVWKAFINNCKGLMRPISGSLSMPARATPKAWQPVCLAAQDSNLNEKSNANEIRQFLEQNLQAWRLQNADGSIAKNTVTGYYEPLVRASRTKQGKYQWPLYAVPDDLLNIELGEVYPDLAGKRVRGKLVGSKIVPYDTREQIASDANRQPPVIVWVDDPVEAFFLQIQGSGRAVLPDGKMIRLAYANHNGRPYASIGQWLVNQGQLTLNQASMQNIKKWAQNNPGRTQEMLNANPAMVFFKEQTISDPELGPAGAYGISLNQQRSIAVDTSFVPLGTPVYLATTMPSSNQPLRNLVFAQDTGAAIKGAARADFYWGFGEEAGNFAGKMKQTGEMWLLWPKGAGAPSAR